MDYLPQIAQQGLLGVMLVVSLLSVWFLYRENRSLQEKRITDLIQTRDAYLQAIQGVKQTVDLIVNILQEQPRGRRR